MGLSHNPLMERCLSHAFSFLCKDPIFWEVVGRDSEGGGLQDGASIPVDLYTLLSLSSPHDLGADTARGREPERYTCTNVDNEREICMWKCGQ